ncbi:MAG: inorganic phosphate transporter [Buchnera aphidicola (Nurudea yanoniella)]
MSHFSAYLSYDDTFLIIIAFLMILLYEVINGFHDSANAIATVICTHTLRSELAVITSGIFNFFGVMFGGLSVAYAIVHLLPIDLLLNINSLYSLKAIFSMLFAAMLWNLCTWILGLPTSSSHTLIGAIIGINITYALSNNLSIVDVFNFNKLLNVFLSLIISPLVGLILAGFLAIVLKFFLKNNKKDYCINANVKNKKNIRPPFLVKLILILSSMGVSYSHGANDGQKGIGLIMLALICIFPSGYFINLNTTQYDINKVKYSIFDFQQYYIHNKSYLKNSTNIIKNYINNIDLVKHLKFVDEKILFILDNSYKSLKDIMNYKELNVDQRYKLRQSLLVITEFIDIINSHSNITSYDKHFLNDLKKNLSSSIEYAPIWIIVLVALSLSLGTLIGWKRIVTTFGEKIGKKDITYIQAISSQLTAAISIGTASYTGVPVSTTHIISSSITGAILIDGEGIQTRTIKNIIIAWILTFPVSIILSSFFYWVSLKLIY